MNRTSLGLLLAIGLIVAGLWWMRSTQLRGAGGSPRAAANSEEARVTANIPPASSATRPKGSHADEGPEIRPRPVSSDFSAGKGFASPERMDEHYRKHGGEFGNISVTEYVLLAQRLRDVPVGGSILEVRRDNGDVARFDRDSGAFGVFESNGTIRTFFRPNDGEAYFRRQVRQHS